MSRLGLKKSESLKGFKQKRVLTVQQMYLLFVILKSLVSRSGRGSKGLKDKLSLKKGVPTVHQRYFLSVILKL